MKSLKLESEAESIKSVMAITIGFIALFLFYDIKWACYFSLFIGCAGLFSSYLAKTIHQIWTKIGNILGLIVPNIILSLIFFFILMPLAILSRISKNSNQLNLKNKKNSLFIEVNKLFSKSDFEKTW